MKNKQCMDEQLALRLPLRSPHRVNKTKGRSEGVPIMAQRERTRRVSVRMRVRSLASFSGLRIWHHCGCDVGRSAAQIPHIAVAVAVV